MTGPRRVTDQNTRLKMAREQAGFATASEAASRFGWKAPTYLGHENGQRGFSPHTAQAYAHAFRVSPEWLLLGRVASPQKTPPLAGYVGANAEIYPVDAGDSLDDIAPPPEIGPCAAAIVVRTDSLWPRDSEGDRLILDSPAPLASVNGQECVIGLADRRRLLKRVRLMSGAQIVLLENHNVAPIALPKEQISSAARILWVRRA